MNNATPPAERHLNLVIALMNATKPLTRRDIQTKVAGYDAQADSKTFERMFERDKEMLRELGVPIVTVESPLSHATELGYRVDKDQFALGEFELNPSEIGLLSLATKLWQDTALETESERGLTKLKSQAASVDSAVLAGFDPRLGHDSPALEPLLDAVTNRQVVSFEYRTGHTGATAVRTIQPWTVLARGSGWYVAGWDIEKSSQRLFKLNRITSAVKPQGKPSAYAIPEDLDASAMLGSVGREPKTAQLAVKAGGAQGLRLLAKAATHVVPDNYDAYELAFHDLVETADDLAGMADAVLVMAPLELRHQVIARLREATHFADQEAR